MNAPRKNAGLQRSRCISASSLVLNLRHWLFSFAPPGTSAPAGLSVFPDRHQKKGASPWRRIHPRRFYRKQKKRQWAAIFSAHRRPDLPPFFCPTPLKKFPRKPQFFLFSPRKPSGLRSTRTTPRGCGRTRPRRSTPWAQFQRQKSGHRRGPRSFCLPAHLLGRPWCFAGPGLLSADLPELPAVKDSPTVNAGKSKPPCKNPELVYFTRTVPGTIDVYIRPPYSPPTALQVPFRNPAFCPPTIPNPAISPAGNARHKNRAGHAARPVFVSILFFRPDPGPSVPLWPVIYSLASSAQLPLRLP